MVRSSMSCEQYICSQLLLQCFSRLTSHVAQICLASVSLYLSSQDTPLKQLAIIVQAIAEIHLPGPGMAVAIC